MRPDPVITATEIFWARVIGMAIVALFVFILGMWYAL